MKKVILDKKKSFNSVRLEVYKDVYWQLTSIRCDALMGDRVGGELLQLHL